MTNYQNSPKKILLLGKNGQVGWELQRTLSPLGDIIALGREDLDLIQAGDIRRTVQEIRPDIIVNAAAYTAVDRAEKEAGLAMAINGDAPGVLAEEAKKQGSLLVHYSTDYVFDGTKDSPYTEEDKPNPLNVYGKTKLAGERAIQGVDGNYLVFRTSWVYGTRGQNFFLTILRLARERDEIKVVDDQIGAPTWCRMIAEATALILAQGINRDEGFQGYFEKKKGIYHMTAGGQTSWYEFAKQIILNNPLFTKGLNVKIIPIKSEDYNNIAKRPRYSVLKNSLVKLPEWKLSLKLVCSKEQNP
ncbi:MAG: dTDP-4-dehydrorhamnose reductase [Peptococcaceae bacterium]|nr:dTDP-4-dehydrorhamnose reductase [Peptococcaceae bacterium]